MTVLFLPPRITEHDAARLFWRRHYGNLFGLLRCRPVKQSPDGLPASIEFLWMPAYAFRLALTKGAIRSGTWVSVDASFGGFAMFERQDILEEGELQHECCPPVIDEDAAEKLARRGLLRFVLRRRGAKPVIEEVLDRRFYYQPVWVYYYYRLGRKIDLAVLDGYTGLPMGVQIRVAIVNAFIQKKREAASQA